MNDFINAFEVLSVRYVPFFFSLAASGTPLPAPGTPIYPLINLLIHC